MAGDLVKGIVDDDSRISRLPDDVICGILSKLDDTAQAVRTSVLSRRWKQLWTRVSTLAFIFKSWAVWSGNECRGDICESLETGWLIYHSYGIRDFGEDLGLMNLNLEDYCGSNAVASAAAVKDANLDKEWSLREYVKFMTFRRLKDEARSDAVAAAVTDTYREQWRSLEFVNVVLSKHQNLHCLRNFRLFGRSGPFTELYVASSANEWLSRVVGPEIETIDINVWGFRFPLQLPPRTDLKKLRVLKLGMGFRLLLDNFPLCLPSLKTLQLCHIHWGALDDTPTASGGAAMMSRLISSCPVLETLHLEWDLECHHHVAQEVFHICSSSLKYLTISIGLCVIVGWPAAAVVGSAGAFTTVHVTAPSLVHLSFQITCGTAEYKFGSNVNDHDGIAFTYRAVGCLVHNVHQNIAIMPITDLVVLNKLKIMPAVQNSAKLSCSAYHVPKWQELSKLTHLIIRLATHQYFPCHLLNRLPSLVSLHLIVEETSSGCDSSSSSSSGTTRGGKGIIRKPLKYNVPSCLSSLLKVIEIKGLNGFNDETQLALAYLLKNGKVLTELSLHFTSADPLQTSAIRETLLALERVSSDCRVTVATLK